MSVQCYHAKDIVGDFKKLSGHHFVALTGRDWKDGSCDDILQSKLWNFDAVITGDFRKVSKIRTVFPKNIEFRLFTLNRYLLSFGRDIDDTVREFSYNIRKDICIDSNDSVGKDGSFYSGFNSKLGIIGDEFYFLGGCINQNTLQNGHGCLTGDSLCCNIDCCDQIGLIDL